MPTCKVEGCQTKSRTLGLCNKHAMRLKKFGCTDDNLQTHAPLVERLRRRTVEQANGCLLWAGPKRPNGYGHIQEGGKGSRTLSTHKLAYELHHGPVPKGMVVMHSCDNPACVNPAHLSVGTFKENTADMIAKGRKRTVAPLGARNGKAVLNAEMVRYIRKETEKNMVELAAELGVSRSTVRGVRSGRCWGHVE